MYGGEISNWNTGLSAAAVQLIESSTFNFMGGKLDNCSGGTGGAISSTGGLSPDGRGITVNITGGEITNCTSTNCGGAAVCFDGEYAVLNMSGGLIDNCTAVNENPGQYQYPYGGAFYMLDYCVLNITGGEISNCSANYGGVAYCQKLSSITVGGDAKIHDNKSTEKGGGVFYISSIPSFNIEGDAKIYKNTSEGDGGVIGTQGSNTITIGGNAKIYNNTSKKYAGAVYLSSGTCYFKGNAEICDNNAASYGGAVFNVQSTIYVQENCKINGNKTPAYGGGIFLYGLGTTYMSGGELRGNNASYGGGLFLNKYSTIAATFNMTGGVIAENTAKQGAGLYLHSPTSTFNLTNGEVTRNIASEICGGLFVRGTANVSNSFKIYDNFAFYGGDDIYKISASTLNLGTAPTTCKLRGCHTVDGWYDDSQNDRWYCYIDPSMTPKTPISPGTFGSGTVVYLKAAHRSYKAFSHEAQGRLLNKIDTTDSDDIGKNGAVTAFFDFEQTADDWYIGASEKLPVGTKMTLIYYPDGTESTCSYYHYEVDEETYQVAFSDFHRMGESTPFERTDTNDHFKCQICFVFPENNELEEIKLWIADTDLAQEYPNVALRSITFLEGGVSKPTADVVISDEQGGESSMSATVSVSGLGNLSRDLADPDNVLNSALPDYKEVFTLELLDAVGRRMTFPDDAVVTINGVDMNVDSGVATIALDDSSDRVYDIQVDNIHKGKFKLRASVCAVSDSITTNPLGLVIDSASSSVISITPKEYAIGAQLSDDEVNRVFPRPLTEKRLEFDVSYIDSAASASDISIKTYVKLSSGAYAATSPWSTSISGGSGSAHAVVKVPAETPAGTYRIAFEIEDATEYYNIIITE